MRQDRWRKGIRLSVACSGQHSDGGHEVLICDDGQDDEEDDGHSCSRRLPL